MKYIKIIQNLSHDNINSKRVVFRTQHNLLPYLEIHLIFMEFYVLFKNCSNNFGRWTQNSNWDSKRNEFLPNDIIICPFKRSTTTQRVRHLETRHCIITLLESYNGYMLSTKYNKVHTLVIVSLIILVLVMKVSHLF